MSDYKFVLNSGETIPVEIESRRGLRNITLRPKLRPDRMIHISKPWLSSDGSALRFLEDKRKWCEKIFASAQPKKILSVGDTIEFLGRIVLLRHDVQSRVNRFVPGADDMHFVLTVGGGADMFESRIRDFIKSEFLLEIKKIIKTVPPEFRPVRIAVRDTATRWGSCSVSGTVSFSWRLAFAPPAVMRYVVMHELAHRKYMNHSPEFWHQVSELYGFGVERAKRWLNQNGASLYGYF